VVKAAGSVDRVDKVAFVCCGGSPPLIGGTVLRDASAAIGVTVASDEVGGARVDLGSGAAGGDLSVFLGASPVTISGSLPGPSVLASALTAGPVGAGATAATAWGLAIGAGGAALGPGCEFCADASAVVAI
jgi:hypothetical protein